MLRSLAVLVQMVWRSIVQLCAFRLVAYPLPFNFLIGKIGRVYLLKCLLRTKLHMKGLAWCLEPSKHSINIIYHHLYYFLLLPKDLFVTLNLSTWKSYYSMKEPVFEQTL